MKLRRKKPCKECPFQKGAIPGWLGPWTAQTIVQQAHSESGLACHVDAAAKKDVPDDELYDTVHACVGSLANANISCKRYANPELNAYAKKVGVIEGIMDVREFFQRHTSRLAVFLNTEKINKRRKP